MSSNPLKPAESTVATLLSQAAQTGGMTILTAANGYITLGITVLGVVIPLAKALISEIASIGKGSVTISFSDLVAADQLELDAIAKTAGDDLAAINAELVRLGHPGLPASTGPGGGITQ